MKIGTFQSAHWGTVTAKTDQYADGNLAIMFYTSDGEFLGKLSTNLPESNKLPPRCFYVKTWSENGQLAHEAYNSGLFTERADLLTVQSGFITVPVWEYKAP